MQWSNFLTNAGTYRNYLNAVAFGADVLGLDSSPTRHTTVLRAKRALKQRQLPGKTKQFIAFVLLEMLVALAKREGDRVAAALYIISYAFLLRVPSEGLPIVVGAGSCDVQRLAGQHSSLAINNADELVLTLAKRKNRPQGSQLVRACWCV